MQCFDDDMAQDQLDKAAFKFTHKLMGHPALSLENLARVLPALPSGHVMYSKGLLKLNDDFEATFKERPADRSLEETIENIRVSDSYIMVSQPEIDDSFKSVYRQLIDDVQTLMKKNGVSNTVIDPKLFLFIASPNSITPFHIDRYSTFLMQFRGSKEVTVFPQWDERVVSAANREAYVAYSNTKLPWTEETDQLGTTFTFSPGEALHIPFIAGHHVRNGSSDVSISMSIIFNTEQSIAWRDALRFNHMTRKYFGPIGMTPSAVGRSDLRDSTKAQLLKATQQVKRILRR